MPIKISVTYFIINYAHSKHEIVKISVVEVKNLNNIKLPKNTSNIEAIQNMVRQKISNWSAGFNKHELINFADELILKDIWFFPLDIFGVNTLYETRFVFKEDVPCKISETDCTTNTGCLYKDPSEVDIWNLEIGNSRISYENQSSTVIVPDSIRIETCQLCSGNGKTNCKTCNGKGYSTCSTCKGAGFSKCYSCGGNGSIHCTYCRGMGYQSQQEYGSSEYKSVTCNRCHGTGKIDCSTCQQGKVTCQNCGGKIKLTCNACGGNRLIACEKCAGLGAVKHTILVKQDICVNKHVYTYVHPKVLKHFPDFSPKAKLSNAVDYQINQVESDCILSGKDYKEIAPEHLITYDDFNQFLNKIVKGERSKEDMGRIVRQKIEHYQSEIYIASYEFSDRKYKLIIDLYSGNVYAPLSPFSEMARDFEVIAREMILKKRYSEALKIAKEAEILGRGSKFQSSTLQLVDEVERLMLNHYKIGITVGVLISWAYYLLGLYSAHSVSSRWEIEYFQLGYAIIVSVGLLIAMFGLGNRISKFLGKLTIPKEYVRTIVGIAISVLLLIGGMKLFQ